MNLEKRFAISNFLIICGIIIVAFTIGCTNQNIGMYFGISTIALYVFAMCLSFGIHAIIKNRDKSPFLFIILILFLLVFFIPTTKFYMDLPDFFKGNYDEESGIVEYSHNSKAELTVRINGNEFEFWGWNVNEDDFFVGSKMKIYYLTKSKKGVGFELLKE